jgi:hypothetical protein
MEMKRLDRSFVGHHVSQGTLKSEDLAATIQEFLDEHTEHSFQEEIEAISDWSSPMADELMDEMFDFMDDIAPEGTMFGSHMGDGALFGFYVADEDDGFVCLADGCEALATCTCGHCPEHHPDNAIGAIAGLLKQAEQGRVEPVLRVAKYILRDDSSSRTILLFAENILVAYYTRGQEELVSFLRALLKQLEAANNRVTATMGQLFSAN